MALEPALFEVVPCRRLIRNATDLFFAHDGLLVECSAQEPSTATSRSTVHFKPVPRLLQSLSEPRARHPGCYRRKEPRARSERVPKQSTQVACVSSMRPLSLASSGPQTGSTLPLSVAGQSASAVQPRTHSQAPQTSGSFTGKASSPPDPVRQ